jgi:sugar phosphate isomerase/epimerase
VAFVPAYCLNGFSDHDLIDALELLAGLGYGGVAFTLGPPHLPGELQLAEAVGELLQELGLAAVLETGGRYWLDPARKHFPVLVSPGAEARNLRREALAEAVGVAVALNSPVLHCWSGAVEDGTAEDEAWQWLLEGLRPVCDAAAAAGIVVGFEPEPGHLVATLDDWRRLKSELGHPALRLTLDLGHIVCSEPEPWPAALRAAMSDVVHIQIDDHRPGTHEHLPFGDGVAPLAELLAVITESGYAGQVAVELARHSHDAPNQARRSIEVLRAALP